MASAMSRSLRSCCSRAARFAAARSSCRSHFLLSFRGLAGILGCFGTFRGGVLGLLQSRCGTGIDLGGLLGELRGGLGFFGQVAGFLLAKIFDRFLNLLLRLGESRVRFFLRTLGRFGLATLDLLLGRAGFLGSFGSGFARFLGGGITGGSLRFAGQFFRFGGSSFGLRLGSGVGLAGGSLGSFCGSLFGGLHRFGQSFAGILPGGIGFGGFAVEQFLGGFGGIFRGVLQSLGNFALGFFGDLSRCFGNLLLGNAASSGLLDLPRASSSAFASALA